MNRRALAIALALMVTAGAAAVQPVVATSPAGGVTWRVDHSKKTITVFVKLQLYSGCSGNPYGEADAQAHACHSRGSQVTQLLVDRIKGEMETAWNKGYHYRCYRLIVSVDIALAPDSSHIEADRLGVRIDPSPVDVRSWVDGGKNYDPTKWRSNDPADRVVPQKGGDHPTTWLEGGKGGQRLETYAHELGHILGLSDGYHDARDPKTGKTIGVPNAGAPFDLMSTGGSGIAQETIDRLVERNRDQLVDKDGDPVELKDLVCDRTFRATLVARDNDYRASHFMNSAPACPSPEVTSSTKQSMNVKSETTDLKVVEAADAGALGYRLAPVFDVLMLQNGMSTAVTRNTDQLGLFDLPVTVDVERNFSTPAVGDVPEVLDEHDSICSGGNESTPRPADCGTRTYRSWMAVSSVGGDEVKLGASVLPSTLSGIGYSETRLDLLYRNCPGPRPWPGDFASGSDATVTYGQLPSLEAINKIHDDWSQDGKAGQVEIDGTAALNRRQPGSLTDDQYSWTLTLCPLNQDGNPPPGCPSP